MVRCIIAPFRGSYWIWLLPLVVSTALLFASIRPVSSSPERADQGAELVADNQSVLPLHTILHRDEARLPSDRLQSRLPELQINRTIEQLRSQASSFVQRRGNSGEVPGVAYGALYSSELLVQSGSGFGPLSTVPIASTSKPFTSFAILRLARVGLIELDAPLYDIFPEFRRFELDFDRPVTIRDLLHHRSGIPYRSGRFIQFNGIQIPAPRSAAGRHHEYSNHNYELLGRIIAHTTAMSFAESISKLVLEPLGLKHTEVAGFARGASGIRSSVHDLTRFGQALLDEYRLDPENSYIAEIARRPDGVPGATGQEYYGLGWRVTLRDGKIWRLNHAGEWNHGIAWLGVYPQAHFSAAYVANPPEFRIDASRSVRGTLVPLSDRLADEIERSLVGSLTHNNISPIEIEKNLLVMSNEEKQSNPGGGIIVTLSEQQIDFAQRLHTLTHTLAAAFQR